MIDLHSHTTFSDGEHSPAELFEMARKAGVTTLAVTDHDTVSGVALCTEAAKAHGVTYVPGIEISVLLNRREVHILGHFVNANEPGLASFSTRLKTERMTRMEMMVAKMRELGFPVEIEDVVAIAGTAGNIARPHLARALLEKNFVASTKEAFDRFLGDGKPAYVSRFKVTPADAIAMIRTAGGTATVAHPGVSKIERHEIEEMAAAGLAGIEVDHTDHPPSAREKFNRWAAEFNLIGTAGSDFHGAITAPGRKLGTASMNAEKFDALRSRASTAVIV